MATEYKTGGFDAPVVYKDKAFNNTIVEISTTSANLTGWRITNPNSTSAYIKFFNSADKDTIILGTTEPVKEFTIQALSEIYLGHARNVSQYYFHDGICAVAVAGLPTSSTGGMILDLDIEIYFVRDVITNS